MGHRSARLRRAGFTLVELLVVIGIIALLISILMPALTRARNQALSIKCSNQGRQIYMACQMFAADNKGYLPRPSVGPADHANTGADAEKKCAFTHGDTSLWGIIDLNRGALVPYIPGGEQARKDTMFCPGDLNERTQGGGPATSDRRNFSYSMNAHVLPDPGRRLPNNGGRTYGIRLSSVKAAANKIYLFEEQAPNDLWCLLWDIGDVNVDPHPMRSDDILTARHAGQRYINATRQTSPFTPDWRRYGIVGRGNHTFFDGHVENLSPNQVYMRPRYFQLNVAE